MLKVVFLTSGFPTPDNPGHGIFNQRAANAISKFVDLTVVQYRLFLPGRKFYQEIQESGYKRVILCVPYIPAMEEKMYFINASIYGMFTKWFLGKLLKQTDVVHAGEGNLGIIASKLKKGYKFKLLTQFIGADLDQDLRKQQHKLKNFGSKLDAVAFNSNYLKNKFIELFGSHKKMQVIYRGVDTDKFSPEGKKENNKLVFYFIGGLTNYSNYPTGRNTKGGFTLMKAWQLLEESLPQAQMELNFAGPDSDSEMAQEWKKSLKFPEKVNLLGKINPAQVADFHKSGNVAIIPSLAEGLPNAGMEAASTGNAIIATPIGGIPEIIEDNFNGLFFEADNAEQLCERMKYLVQNPQEVARMGNNGRQKMVNAFSSADFGKKYFELYKQICSNS